MFKDEILSLPKARESRVRRMLARTKIADLPILEAAVGEATGDWRRAAIRTRIEQLKKGPTHAEA